MGSNYSSRLASVLTVLTVCSCVTSSDKAHLEGFYVDGLLEEAGFTGVRIERLPKVKGGYQVVTTGELVTGTAGIAQAIVVCAMSYQAKLNGEIWFQTDLESGEGWGVKIAPLEAAFHFVVDSNLTPKPQSMAAVISMMGWNWCQSIAKPQYRWEQPEDYQSFLAQPQ